jgi:nitroimidazol reductase NimA-like FMN-containing flavoprotein (pyridoxamine 5'-phosphate oxidase superfamily)
MTDEGSSTSVPVIRFLELLGQCRVGRVAVLLSGVPHVVPVNYAVFEGDVAFRSGTGTKLHAAIESQPVSFEVDRIDEATRTGWSVLVSGAATVVTDGEVRARIEALDLEAWAPGTRDELVLVRAELVSGREITRP